MAHTAPDAAPPTAARAKRWRLADHDQRRRLIAEAALDLLRRHGMARVSIRRVADRLGVGAMTLYTYVKGQEDLRQHMIRRGFEMLNDNCNAASTLETPDRWRGGARSYIQFAIDHPHLYELMFTTPLPPGDEALLRGGFSQLHDKVRQRLAAAGHPPAGLDAEATRRAGRFWIALHGLASLAVAQRLVVLEADVDALLDDLLPRVAPD